MLVLALVAAACSSGPDDEAFFGPEPIAVEGISDAVEVSVGDDHACALRPDGGISCWGSNWFGQLGDATGADSALPVEVRGIPKAVAVSAGAHRSCAVLEEGTVSCWGPAGRRPLGKVEEPTPPVAVTGVENAVAVAAGEDWDCAVVASGSVWCWNDPEAEPGDTGKEVISGVSNATAVSVNGAGACALREGGTVVCWGLADGLESDPVAVQGISGATAISSTLTYPEQTCALLRDATVECWATAQEPRAVEGISAATAISGLCAVVDDGSVSCWSRPDGADPEAELSPVVVRGVADATSVSSNRWGGSCAVHGGGQVTCWGEAPGAPSSSATDSSSSTPDTTAAAAPPRLPTTVAGVDSASAITLGGLFACVVIDGGSVECWSHASGEPGPPVAVDGIDTATSVSVFESGSACAALVDRTAVCWHVTTNFPEADATALGVDVAPFPVRNVAGVGSIDVVNADDGCAIVRGGALTCWPLRLRTDIEDGREIGVAAGLPGVAGASIVSGRCLLFATGSVACWDRNGEAVSVNGVATATHLSSGSIVDFDIPACVVLDTGSVECWGENDYGQLGNGDTARVDPRKGTATVEGVSNASTVSTAFGYACAALEDGTATCWGLNSTGQLGDGTTTAHETPIAVQALSGVTAVAAGEGTACALIDDGTVSCWGGSR